MTDPAFPAAPFSEVTHLDLGATPLAIVRHDGVTVAQLPSLFGGAYTAIAALFADGTLTPTGPALAVYYGNPMSTFDLEIGFPVLAGPAEPILVGDAQVRGSALPAGPAAALTHIGGYDQLPRTWAALGAACGGEPAGIWIESYVLSGPSGDAARARTDLIMPLRR